MRLPRPRSLRRAPPKPEETHDPHRVRFAVCSRVRARRGLRRGRRPLSRATDPPHRRSTRRRRRHQRAHPRRRARPGPRPDGRRGQPPGRGQRASAPSWSPEQPPTATRSGWAASAWPSTWRSTDKLPFDTLRDFVPISLVTGQPNILVAHPVAAREIVQGVRSRSRARSRASSPTARPASAPARTSRWSCWLMSQKVQLVHVPYKGTAPALTAVCSATRSRSVSRLSRRRCRTSRPSACARSR